MDTTSPTSGLRKMARAQVIPSWLHRPSRMAGGRADCILPATTSSSVRTRTHGASVSTTVPPTIVSHWRQLRVLMLTDSPSQHRKWYREFERRLQLRFNFVENRKVLQYLQDHDLTATFFVVGSRVVSRPDTLIAEYMAGNEISAHTWSHPVRHPALLTSHKSSLTCPAVDPSTATHIPDKRANRRRARLDPPGYQDRAGSDADDHASTVRRHRSVHWWSQTRPLVFTL